MTERRPIIVDAGTLRELAPGETVIGHVASDEIRHIAVVSQDAYDALSEPDPETLYLIPEPETEPAYSLDDFAIYADFVNEVYFLDGQAVALDDILGAIGTDGITANGLEVLQGEDDTLPVFTAAAEGHIFSTDRAVFVEWLDMTDSLLDRDIGREMIAMPFFDGGSGWFEYWLRGPDDGFNPGQMFMETWTGGNGASGTTIDEDAVNRTGYTWLSPTSARIRLNQGPSVLVEDLTRDGNPTSAYLGNWNQNSDFVIHGAFRKLVVLNQALSQPTFDADFDTVLDFVPA